MKSNSSSSVLHKPDSSEDFPSSWTWKRLDEISQVIDCPHTTPDTADAGPLMVRTQDIRTGTFRTQEAAHVSEDTYQERIKRGKPEHGDLFFSREGTYFGVAAEVPKNYRVCLGQRMVLIKVDGALVNHRYLKYWLNSPVLSHHLKGFYAGTTAQRLNLRAIRGIAVPLPPRAEQDRIANILGTLDDKIDLNRKMNRTLEAMARAIFKSWFIDFDPIRAKMAGEEPTGVDPETAALFPDRLVDSELGEIPEGWEVKKLKKLARLRNGKRPPDRADSRDELHRIPSYGAGGQNGWVTKAFFKHPVLLTGRVGTLGKVFRVATPSWPSDNTIAIWPREMSFFHFLFFHLERFDLARLNVGSTQPLLTQRDLKSQDLACPPQALVERFTQLAVSLFKRCDANESESSTLSTLRDVLLPKLLSGEQ